MTDISPPTLLTGKQAGATLAGIVLLFVLICILSIAFQQPLRQFSQIIVTSLGMKGLFAAVFIVDVIPAPLSWIPLILFALEGQIQPVTVFVFVSTASVLAGCAGYWLGRLFGLPKRFKSHLQRRYPGRLKQIRARGAVAILIGGMMPIPFALVTWTVGAMKTPYQWVMAACLIRIVKVGIYFTLIMSGLSFGAP